MPSAQKAPIRRIHPESLKKVSLSNRQYSALKMFIDASSAIKTDEALSIDQRSLGSLFLRGYIRFNGAGFLITPLGNQAMSIFETTTVWKEKPGDTFSTYIRTVNALKDYHRRNT